jgi:hypothetical protein
MYNNHSNACHQGIQLQKVNDNNVIVFAPSSQVMFSAVNICSGHTNPYEIFEIIKTSSSSNFWASISQA